MGDLFRQITLPRIHDPRGNLTVVEDGSVPFPIARTYWLYDVPAGESRGGHGHRHLEQVFLALAGSFNLTVSDDKDAETIVLNSPFVGVYVPAMRWRSLCHFSGGAVCLVLASRAYDEADYFRDPEAFQVAASEKRKGTR